MTNWLPMVAPAKSTRAPLQTLSTSTIVGARSVATGSHGHSGNAAAAVAFCAMATNSHRQSGRRTAGSRPGLLNRTRIEILDDPGRPPGSLRRDIHHLVILHHRIIAVGHRYCLRDIRAD